MHMGMETICPCTWE